MARISAAKFTNRDILVTGTDPSTGEYLSAAQRKALFRQRNISSNQVFRNPRALTKVDPQKLVPSGAIVKADPQKPISSGAIVKADPSQIVTQKPSAIQPNINILQIRVSVLEKQVSFLAKALDKEAELEKKQQKEKEKKLLQQEESGRRSAKEKQLEKSLSDKLLSPVKAIGGIAKGLLGGLMELFGTLFAGWLTDKGWKALKAFAEGNTDELNKIAGNVGKTLLVIGGIFLALNGGIGVVLGLIPAIIGGLLSVSALLLNPLTWKAILAAGAVAATAQIFEAGKEHLDPGQRSRERVLKTLGIDETAFDVGKGQRAEDYGLKPTKKYQTTDAGSLGESQFYQIGNKYYIKSEIDRFLWSKGEFGEVRVYEKTQLMSLGKMRDMMKFVGKEKVDLKSLQEGKAFIGADKLRESLVAQRTKIRMGAAYKEYYKSNEDLYRQQEDINFRKKLLETETEPRKIKTLKRQIAELESKIPTMVNNKKFALSKVGEFYDFLSDSDKEKLKSELGIEKDKYVPDLLNTGQLQYTLNKFVAPIQERVKEAQEKLEASTSVTPAAPTPPATPAVPAAPATPAAPVSAEVSQPKVTKQPPGPVKKEGKTQVIYKKVASGGGAQMQQPLKSGSATDVPLIASSNPNNFYTMYSQMVYNVVI